MKDHTREIIKLKQQLRKLKSKKKLHEEAMRMARIKLSTESKIASLQAIAKDHDSGQTFREIAHKLGLSAGRVGEKYHYYKRLLERQKLLEPEVTPDTKACDLPLSVRAANCLNNACLLDLTLRELVERKTERDLLEHRNFGKHSLTELKMALAKAGLILKEV